MQTLTSLGLEHEELPHHIRSIVCQCYVGLSHAGKKVTWRHSMIFVKHEMQFQLINSIVNRQHVNTLEFTYTDMRSGSKVEKISHNFVL